MEFENQGLDIPVTIVCPSLIATGMFEGSKPSFLAPWIPPEKMARIIYRHFKKNRAYVMAPLIVKAMPFSKALLPAAWFDMIFKFLGLFSAFDEHKGRA
jgi:short-subunit dehydrogenase